MIHHCYGCPCCSCPCCGRPYRSWPRPWVPGPVWGGGPASVQAKFRPDAALAQARDALRAR